MSHLLPRERMHLLSRQQLPLIYPPIHGIQNLFTNVLLIDNSVPDYKIFVDSANSSTFPIVYSTTSSKTELLALLQTHFTSISRIGIVFASSLENSKPFLDWKPLFNENEVEPYSENTQFIIDVIKEFSVTNIDYLACNTLNYSNWTNYYQLLAQNTGVIVGASNDKTGNIKFGGDWLMESSGQDIELIYFTQSIEYYTYLLDTVTDTIPVGTNPQYMAINSSTNRLYVANYSSNNVSVIDTTTNTVTATITVGTSPGNMVINSSTNRLYVVNYESNTVSVIDTTTNTVSTTITVGTAPFNMVLNSAANLLYVANFVSDNVSVIDTTTNTVSSTITVGLRPNNMVLNSSTNRLYVANSADIYVSVIDTTTNTVSTTIIINTGGSATNLFLNSSTNLLYVTDYAGGGGGFFFGTVTVIDTTTNTVVTTINVGDYPNYMVLKSSTSLLYVGNFDSISVIDTTTNTVSYTITGGVYPSYMVLNSSGSLLYIANGFGGNYVSVINTSSNTVSETIPVGTTPLYLALNSSTKKLYVANYDSSNVSVITPTPYPCFNKDTKILTDKGYIPIQDLRKGDLVKTSLHDFKPIDMIGFRDIHHPACEERIKDQLYKCSQTEYPEVFEPLILTGCHSILVDDFTSNEQRDKVIEINGNTYITDNKYRLPASADERAHVYEIPGNFTIYHVALENDDYYMNYGIFANGLLVESCSKRYLKELSNMTLIE